jgi:hypothetical protein
LLYFAREKEEIMTNQQREQNPDVNSYEPDVGPGESPDVTAPNSRSSDIERKKENDVIPVPPDTRPTAPVEEPVGDVDDSPKRIA